MRQMFKEDRKFVLDLPGYQVQVSFLSLNPDSVQLQGLASTEGREREGKCPEVEFYSL